MSRRKGSTLPQFPPGGFDGIGGSGLEKREYCRRVGDGEVVVVLSGPKAESILIVGVLRLVHGSRISTQRLISVVLDRVRAWERSASAVLLRFDTARSLVYGGQRGERHRRRNVGQLRLQRQ
ncbi:hypothetical protein BDZ89DRAFT_1111866 [Hymenopellis radicata]|nr:hypothetical protein BDZ89DRAFT_1111866 [Hymenopellis radicata]